MASMAIMAKKKTDRHKTKIFPVRLHQVLRTQLEILADRKLTTLTSEVVEAIRRHLEANGLWPVEQPKK